MQALNSILTVSAVNTYVSFKLKNDPKLKGIAVSGEISDISINSLSGHIYFTLTDGKANIKAVMFASNAARLSFIPEVGRSVVAFGGIDVYERGGVYQLNCTQLLPQGKGADYLALLMLKDELEKAGVFSAPKKEIPKYPNKIAVVSSPTGAAIKDVLSVVSRRYPITEIVLFPAQVQGAGAVKSIVDALKEADSSGADTVILTRGGGSGEDLSCFNSKDVVTAVYECKTPLVAAIGHEIDLSLCELAADLRAPTPSAAAELCTPDINKIEEEILSLRSQLSSKAQRTVDICIREVTSLKNLLSAYSLEKKAIRLEAQILSLKTSAKNSFDNKIKLYETKLESLKTVISCADPQNVLNKGYALIYKDGRLATDSNRLDGRIEIIMRDGRIYADVLDCGKERKT